MAEGDDLFFAGSVRRPWASPSGQPPLQQDASAGTVVEYYCPVRVDCDAVAGAAAAAPGAFSWHLLISLFVGAAVTVMYVCIEPVVSYPSGCNQSSGPGHWPLPTRHK